MDKDVDAGMSGSGTVRCIYSYDSLTVTMLSNKHDYLLTSKCDATDSITASATTEPDKVYAMSYTSKTIPDIDVTDFFDFTDGCSVTCSLNDVDLASN